MNITLEYKPGIFDIFAKAKPKRKYKEGIKRPRITEEKREKALLLSQYDIPYTVIAKVTDMSATSVGNVIKEAEQAATPTKADEAMDFFYSTEPASVEYNKDTGKIELAYTILSLKGKPYEARYRYCPETGEWGQYKGKEINNFYRSANPEQFYHSYIKKSRA
jgi:hypothetical protein